MNINIQQQIYNSHLGTINFHHPIFAMNSPTNTPTSGTNQTTGQKSQPFALTQNSTATAHNYSKLHQLTTTQHRHSPQYNSPRQRHHIHKLHNQYKKHGFKKSTKTTSHFSSLQTKTTTTFYIPFLTPPLLLFRNTPNIAIYFSTTAHA